MSNKYLCLQCWRISKVDNLFGVAPNDAPRNWRDPPAARGRQRLGDLYPAQWWENMSNESPRDLYKLAIQNGQTVECKCHAPILPCAKLRHERTSAIRIAGPTGSGKTLFLTTIVDNFKQMRLKDMALWGICDTDERFAKVSSALLEDGRRPKSTHKSTGERYAWEIIDKFTQHPLLAIHDIGGETWEQLNHGCDENISRYLALPGHLILVLDGASIADDLGLPSADAWDSDPRRGDGGAKDKTILRYMTDSWNKRDYNRIKLALVITKADLLWDKYPVLQQACSSLSKTEDEQEHLKELLRDSGRGDLLVIAEERLSDCCIFATSSLGFRPQDNDVSVEDRDKLERKPKPSGTILPLLWLLDIEQP
jgi:hypothetical protein